MLELMKHQREGMKFLEQKGRALLADEPGLGKSAQALFAAKPPILIVAPAMVIAGGVWSDELNKWSIRCEVKQVPYSQLMVRDGRKITNQLKPELTRVWGTVIFDEAHYLKGRKTHWTAAAKQIKAERTFLLTGTPLPNWAHEAFTLLQLLYPDEARAGKTFGSYWRWAAEWFNVEPKLNHRGVVLATHVVGELRADRTWKEFIEANWRDRMLLRKRDDCLDLPPLTQSTVTVAMVPAQAKAYRELKKDFITWLESSEVVSAWSQAGKLVKLAQCATGLETIGGEGSGKLDALQTLLQDRPAPTLVAAHFRSSVRACANRALELGKSVAIIDGSVSKGSRGVRVRQFQAGHVDVLCATIDTISEGLTLNAADQVIKVERSWRPSRNEQVLRRIHRIGQTKPVTAIDLVTRDSVDERVLAVLASKSDQQMKALGIKQLKELV